MARAITSAQHEGRAPVLTDRDASSSLEAQPIGSLAMVLLLACFFLSGLAALVYQNAWTRQFAFVFGTSQLAVATVLASYMGGLAAGAAVAGRLAPRVRRPVLVYAILELAIALAALFAVPAGIRVARWLYVGLFGARLELPGEGGAATALFYVAATFLIVLLPTALMGATLPLLARHAVRSERQIGSRVGLLYALNTIGAVAGTILAGFVLLPNLGLRDTVAIAAAVNAFVFVLAWWLARAAPSFPAASALGPRPLAAAAGHWILPLIAVSGAVSFTYEVLWTRLLGFVLGASVYAFATMLASFLTGIALGAAAAARYATEPARAARGFAAVQLGTAALSLAAFAVVDQMPQLAASFGAGTSRLFADAAVAAVVLLPAALCIGATFPLAVRILARETEDAGPASARVFAWNTFGAIAGAIGAGFLFVPLLGFAGAMTAAAAVNLGLAAAAALLAGQGRMMAGLAAAGLALLLLMPPSTPWGVVRHSPLVGAPVPGQLEHFGVGRSATVLLMDRAGAFQLWSDGLPEATIQPPGGRVTRFPLSHWLGMLSALARPEGRTMMIVGLGGGTLLESVAPQVEAIEVVELEPQVVLANRAVATRRRLDPLSDPRVRLVINDARGALLLTQTRYDAIVSQPSHPWTPGASHLYTREFFELVRSRLAPGGVFVQWIGLYFVDEPLMRTLVATLTETFAHVEVYQPEPGGILFLASDEALDMETSAPRALAAAPSFFAEYGVLDASDLALTRGLRAEGSRRVATGAQANTDDRNLLLLRGPRLLGRRLEPFDPEALFAAHAPEAEPLLQVEPGYAVRRLMALGLQGRAARIVAQVEDPGLRAAAEAWLDLSLGNRVGAARGFQTALAADPSAEPAGARLALASLRLGSLLAGDAELEALVAPLAGPAAAVVVGWRHADAGRWEEVAALEEVLATADVRDPTFLEAGRLRARWRLELGGQARAVEAMELLDLVVLVGGDADDLLWRARAARDAGLVRAALAGLHELPAVPMRTTTIRDALLLLRDLPEGPDVHPSERVRIGGQLRRLVQ